MSRSSATGDFEQHHEAAEDNHRPCPPLGMLMASAEKDVAMDRLGQGVEAVMMVVVVVARHGAYFR